MSVRDRSSHASRLPGWVLPIAVPIGAAVGLAVVVVTTFPGPAEGPAGAASTPTPMPPSASAAPPATTRSMPAPTPHPAARTDAGIAAADGRTYLVGGTTDAPLASVVVFDGLVWTDLPPLPEPRSGPGAAALPGGRVLVLGGENETGMLASTLVLEPDASSWQPGTPLPHPQAFMAHAVDDGRVYLIGGSAEGSRDEVLVFDTETQRWSNGEPMPVQLEGASAAASDGSIYVVGKTFDSGRGGQTAMAPALRYDPSADAWTELAPVPLAGQPLTVVAARGRIWAIGGSGERFGRVAYYEPVDDRWTLTDDRLPPGTRWQVVVVSGEQLIVIGASPNSMTSTLIDTNIP